MRTERWKKVPLISLCDKIGDGLHGTPKYSDNSDIFFINGNNLVNGKILVSKNTKKVADFEWHDNFIELNKNSLLLSINGTIGEIAFYKGEKVMLGKSVAYLNFKTGINNFYYYYFQLPNVQKYFYQVATGSTIKNLGLKSIQDFEVPNPNKEIWKPITEILCELDKKIEINNKVNIELEAIAKLIYDYWFVQFDYPDENGKPYKSSGGKMIYNQDLKREIPQGWKVIELGDYIDFQKGISYSSKNIGDSGTPMINLDSFFLNGGYKNEGLKYFNGKVNTNRLCKKGDLVIAVTDVTRNAEIIGKGFSIPDLFDEDVLISTDVAKVELSDQLTKEYILQLFNSENYHSYIKHFATGTLVLHLDLNGIRWSKIALPPMELQKKYSEISRSIQLKFANSIKENQTLIELRDWLLPMLMNGQVKVSQVS